jgi:hypothetical protein
MTTKGKGITFDFDPYKDLKVTENLDKDVLIISKQKLKSILRDAELSLGKKDQWITPFTLLITLIGIFATTEFKQFIVSADTWQAFFLMLSLLSLIWLIWAVRSSLKSRKIEDILNDCMRSIPYNAFQNIVPKVVKTYPKNGTALKVPRSGKEIVLSVTYDQPMWGGYSWAGVENMEYPLAIEGEIPTWSNDRKTCQYRTKVSPHKKYGVSFNVRGKYDSFKSTNGISAEPYLLEFTT